MDGWINERMDGKDREYKLQQRWTLLSQHILESLIDFIRFGIISTYIFPLPRTPKFKTYHSVREEENSVQGAEEKSGFLRAGKQMVVAPDLQQHNKNPVSPRWYLAVLPLPQSTLVYSLCPPSQNPAEAEERKSALCR